jgi:hypothetical protein
MHYRVLVSITQLVETLHVIYRNITYNSYEYCISIYIPCRFSIFLNVFFFVSCMFIENHVTQRRKFHYELNLGNDITFYI